MNEFYEHNISVIDPVSSAFERVKLVLFQPFDPGKWFVIGFCAFLANLCQGGGGGGGSTIENVNWGEIREFIAQHLLVIIIVVATLLLVGFVIWIVLLWLSSRGRFMFLHCVAENKGEVRAPWHKYRIQGNSLFMFRLALGFISLFVFGLLIGIAAILAYVLGRDAGLAPIIIIVVLTILLLIPLGITFGLIGKFTEDFVVPVMYLRNALCMDSWREFMSLLSANKGRFALYILFHIVIDMAIGAIIAAVVLATCCCACCIMMIPYIGTVLLLPVFVFVRSYSLHYLAQYGPDYDAFAQPEIAPPPDSGYYDQPEISGL